jgi:hypothetical protein
MDSVFACRAIIDRSACNVHHVLIDMATREALVVTDLCLRIDSIVAVTCAMVGLNRADRQ